MKLSEVLLKAKHWQLFAMMCGIPILFHFVLIGMIITGAGQINDDVFAVLSVLTAFQILMVIVGATFFGWLWSIALGLQKKLPTKLKLKTGWFKVFLFIPIGYFILLYTFSGSSIGGTIEHVDGPTDPELILRSMAIILPMNLFCMFCIFYCVYIAAKTFKTAELQRDTTFSDFSAEFFLIWIYPIGIWIIQPKINKMITATGI